MRLKLELEVDKLELTPEAPGPADPSTAQTGEAPVVFAQGVTTAALYQRDRLHCGHQMVGPALILQMDTTIVLPPEWQAEVDPLGNLLLELA